MELTLAQPPDEVPSPPRPRRWRAIGVADVAFGVLVVVAVLAYLSRTRGYVFSSDDWVYAQRGHSLVDYFRPYNLSLNVVPIAVYRVLLGLFGFGRTLPLRMLAASTEAAVAVALYLVVRARIAPAAALVVGVSILWYPNEVLYPSTWNFFAALAATVLAAALVVRRRPAEDLLLAVAVAFALMTAPTGVAGAAGCLAYLALRRERRGRRWLAVALPATAWAVWWLTVAHTPRDAAQRSLAQSRQLVVDGVIRSFDGLVADNRVLGGVLMALFAAYLVVTIVGGIRANRRRGWRALVDGLGAADHQLAWSAALVGWWVGLAFSRGFVASATVMRYQLAGSVFVVLAWLPSLRPARLAERLHRAAPTAIALALSAAVIAANNAGIADQARPLTTDSNRLRANMVEANLGPSVVPDWRRIGLGPGDNPSLPSSLYRTLVARYGVPTGTTPTHPDAAVLALLATRLDPDAGGAVDRCLALTSPVTIAGGRAVRLRAPERPVTVRLRRFEPGWTTLGRIPAGRTVVIRLPAGPAPRGWMVAADGACRAVPGP